jgi:hypothetical protein
MHRHHGELRIFSNAIPSCRSRDPIFVASACPQCLPGIRRVIGAGDLCRAAEAEKKREDDEANAAHGGGSRKSRQSGACST